MTAAICRVLHTQPGHVRRRLGWLLYRRWRWAAYRVWVQLVPCDEHDPHTRRVAALGDFLAGEEGQLQTVCGRCRRVLREWDES